jgi:hypothetical protein
MATTISSDTVRRRHSPCVAAAGSLSGCVVQTPQVRRPVMTTAARAQPCRLPLPRSQSQCRRRRRRRRRRWQQLALPLGIPAPMRQPQTCVCSPCTALDFSPRMVNALTAPVCARLRHKATRTAGGRTVTLRIVSRLAVVLHPVLPQRERSLHSRSHNQWSQSRRQPVSPRRHSLRCRRQRWSKHQRQRQHRLRQKPRPLCAAPRADPTVEAASTSMPVPKSSRTVGVSQTKDWTEGSLPPVSVVSRLSTTSGLFLA